MADEILYEKLGTTAKAHILACLPQTVGSNDPSPETILSHLAPSFRMDWGHKVFVSTMPMLQGEKTGEGFVSHLHRMASALQTWSIDIVNTCVDVKTRSAVVRADFHMVAKGAGEEVLNDIVFWLLMDDTGDKVVKCTEFVDPVASAQLAEKMKAAAAK